MNGGTQNSGNLLEKAMGAFNRIRAEESYPDDKIELMDNQYTLIHSFIENLMDDEHIPIKIREEQCREYLEDIAKGKKESFTSEELLQLVKLVCKDLGITYTKENRYT